MFLSNQLLNLFKVTALNRFEDTYKTLFNKNNLNEYLNEFIEESKSTLEAYENIEYKIITPKISYIRKTKQSHFQSCIKNWFGNLSDKADNKKRMDKATKSYHQFLNTDIITLTKKAPEEFQTAEDIFKQVSSVESLLGSFGKLYDAKNFDDYVRKSIDKIYTWVTDNEQGLCSYKYINMLSKTKKKGWFNKDLDLFFYKFIYEHKDLNNPTLVMDVSPMEYNLSIPIDPSNRRTTTVREGNNFLHIHEINDHVRVKTLFIIPTADKNTSKQKLFNLFDSKVIKALIQLSDEDFFTARKVVCDFGDIVKKISSSKNDKIYKEVHNSLKKISSYQSIYEDDLTGESRTYDIYKADIVPKEDYEEDEDLIDKHNLSIKSYKKLVVKVTFSEKYITQLLEGAIFINKDTETLCSMNMAQALILPLQCERYKKFNEDNLVSKLGYNSFFNSVLTLGSSNKSKNMKQIEKALEEIQESKTIIKSFYRTKDFLYVEFYPLLKDEKDNLLNCLEFFTTKGFPINLPFNLTETLDSMNYLID